MLSQKEMIQCNRKERMRVAIFYSDICFFPLPLKRGGGRFYLPSLDLIKVITSFIDPSIHPSIGHDLQQLHVEMDLSRTPAAAPPPGVVPNLDNPTDLSVVSIVIPSIMIFLTIVFVSGRLIQNLKVGKGWGLDDCRSLDHG